jgi:hypothetical protein
MPTLGQIFLVRAPELRNAENLKNVSCQRIEVNLASSKRTSDKKFENLRKFSAMLQNVFFKTSLQFGHIWLQSWSKNAKFYWTIFFCLNVCGFFREKNSKNSSCPS